MIVDYRKWRTEHAPILIDRAAMEQVESLKFLGVHIPNKITSSKRTKTVVKRARQNLFPFRRSNIWHVAYLAFLASKGSTAAPSRAS